MVAAKPSRFLGGLVVTPMEAGPGDLVACLNVMDEHGRMSKRGGQKPVTSLGTWVTSGFYTGWGTTTEPVSVGTGGEVSGASGTHVYIGGGSQFYQFHIYGEAETAPFDTSPGEWKSIIGGMQYWNGSAWTTVQSGDLFTASYDTSTQNFNLAPWFFHDNIVSGISSGFQLRGVISPPSDWAAKTIGGQSKYWLRFRAVNTAGVGNSTSDASLSRFTSSEHPVLFALHFQDRRGTPHQFYVWYSSSTTLKYTLDGTTLTASDGLEPDAASKMFSKSTRVWAYYDAATDRIIGFVEGHTWFFSTTTGNGEIYNLTADGAGTDTPYASVIGGLRSAIPDGVVSCTYDDRIFTLNGQTLVFSSPGVFKDIWPSDNELFIADDAGNGTAMVSVGGVLGIFKRNAIWVCQSDGSADGYSAYRLPGNVGCVAPRSLVVAGDVAFFLAEDGIYLFDGNAVRKVSSAVDGWLMAPGWASSPERAHGVWFSPLNQYRLFYPGPSSESWVLDSAVYVARSEKDGEWTFWPQGRYASTDQGFQATFVTLDDSRPVARVILCDRFGCIWEMDRGLHDVLNPVTFRALSHRVNLGTSQKYLLRWVTPVQPAATNNAWTMRVWPDGNVDGAVSCSPDPGGMMSAAGFYTTAGVYATAGTYAVNLEESAQPAQSVACKGRFVQLEMKDSSAGPWALDAVELDVTQQGRRG